MVVQPIPLGIECCVKAQSSNVSFATLQWKETFELWALSFERAFKNITACEIACIYRHVCICVCACVYAYVQVCMIHACMCAYMYFTRGVHVCNCVLTRLPWSREVALEKREHRISIYIYVCTCAGIYAGMYIYINVYEILYTLIRYTIHPQLSTYICWAWTHRSWSNRIDNVTVCRALTCTTASTTASSHTAQRTEWKKKTYRPFPHTLLHQRDELYDWVHNCVYAYVPTEIDSVCVHTHACAAYAHKFPYCLQAGAETLQLMGQPHGSAHARQSHRVAASSAFFTERLPQLASILLGLLLLALLLLLLLLAALLDFNGDAVRASIRVFALPRRLDILVVVLSWVSSHDCPTLHQAQNAHRHCRKHHCDERSFCEANSGEKWAVSARDEFATCRTNCILKFVQLQVDEETRCCKWYEGHDVVVLGDKGSRVDGCHGNRVGGVAVFSTPACVLSCTMQKERERTERERPHTPRRNAHLFSCRSITRFPDFMFVAAVADQQPRRTVADTLCHCMCYGWAISQVWRGYFTTRARAHKHYTRTHEHTYTHTHTHSHAHSQTGGVWGAWAQGQGQLNGVLRIELNARGGERERERVCVCVCVKERVKYTSTHMCLCFVFMYFRCVCVCIRLFMPSISVCLHGGT